MMNHSVATQVGIDRRRFVSTLGASAGLLALGRAVSAADLPEAGLDSLVGADGVDWQRVRAQLLLGAGVVYFNCGSIRCCWRAGPG